ncbi:MAG: metallophosphoesterase [Gammaproteobacteria bacterium]
MKIPLIQIGSALLYASAGFCVFLMLLNRVLILMPVSKIKAPAILTTFAVLVGAGILFGFFLARPPWVYVPLAVLGLILLGEGRRAFIRRSCAGSSPVDTVPYQFNLAAPITTTDLIVHRYRLPHPKWRGAPLRIVHLTDLHVHPTLPLEYYQEVVSVAEQSEPDIAVFTGDFITSLDALPNLAKVLRPIAKLETYAVLGNHDYWADADAVRNVITESRLRLLSDQTISFRTGENQVAVTGYDYPWGTKDKSITPQRDEMLYIVLSHTPDNIYRISESSADLTFSGHYHAGQIRIPIIGPIVVPSVYGRRFDHGHFVVNNTHLFVASGIGAANPPVRIYCQPDIFVVDIAPEKDT